MKLQLSRWGIADQHLDCVVLSSLGSEFTFLRNVYRFAGFRMHHAESLSDADFLLTVTGSTVLLSDVTFAGGSWREALSLLGESHPLVTMLVIADSIDQPFLGDLFTRGACGVIWKPFQFGVVRRMVRAVHEASRERRILREAGGSVASLYYGGIHHGGPRVPATSSRFPNRS